MNYDDNVKRSKRGEGLGLSCSVSTRGQWSIYLLQKSLSRFLGPYCVELKGRILDIAVRHDFQLEYGAFFSTWLNPLPPANPAACAHSRICVMAFPTRR